MKVLLLADDCNPEWPSLPVVGYKLCRAIAAHTDAVVVTHVRNRENIGKVGFGRAHVEYVDNEYIAAPLYRLATALRGGTKVAWTTNVALAYPSIVAFEREVWKRFGTEIRGGAFDVVHRVTPMSPTLPCPLTRWSPTPVVVGPLNGGLPWPAHFRSELRREREWLTYLRGAYRLLPYYRSTYRRAAAILAAFKHTAADIAGVARAPVINFPEVGIDPELFAAAPTRQPSSRATFLFVGRLVPYKCPDVAVEAFARSERLRQHRLVVVGDGPERPRLEAIIREHHLGSCVELLGWKTQAEVGDWMRQADVFAFPSIRELGAGVVVEAMGCGLPCIVVDYGAPGALVTEHYGRKVPLGDHAHLVEGFAREMEELAERPELRASMAAEAAHHALSEYSWDAKARKLLGVYQWVLGASRELPAPYPAT